MDVGALWQVGQYFAQWVVSQHPPVRCTRSYLRGA